MEIISKYLNQEQETGLKELIEKIRDIVKDELDNGQLIMMAVNDLYLIAHGKKAVNLEGYDYAEWPDLIEAFKKVPDVWELGAISLWFRRKHYDFAPMNKDEA